MIDRTILDALRFFQQNGHILQTMQDHSRLIKSAGIPRIDPVVIQAMEQWSHLNISHLAMPDTHEIRDLLRYTRELSTFHAQFASAASAASLNLPLALFEQSTMEIFSHTRSIEGLFPRRIAEKVGETNAEEEQKQQVIEWIAEETKSEVELWLYQIQPPLYAMWQGARQTLASDNPDRARQVMVSLRTLLDEVTRKLAPDAEVRAWSTDPQYYQDKGKTLRGKGRIFYICRHIQRGNDSFAKFLEADINAITSLWISLNQLHVPEQTLSDVQLRILVERFESALLLLVRASKAHEV